MHHASTGKVCGNIFAAGSFYFGDANTRIRTLLGSCVSITMWHPTRLIGGMCHYLLPSRSKAGNGLDGHYVDEAMLMFLREIKAAQIIFDIWSGDVWVRKQSQTTSQAISRAIK